MAELSKPTVAIIVAALKPNGGIGFQGKMPWRLRKEIKYFKDVTTKTTGTNGINAVVMGRKTWESIPPKFRPLPNRINVVLSRTYNNEILEGGVIHANSITNSLKSLEEYTKTISKQLQRIFVIGGAEIYNELVKSPLVTHLLVTEIESEAPVEMDTFLNFPLHGEDSEWTKQTKPELLQFIGEEQLEDDIKEGSFLYNYTLWKRK